MNKPNEKSTGRQLLINVAVPVTQIIIDIDESLNVYVNNYFTD